MSVALRLVRLYPDPFRERWGSALEVEAQSAGWRSWPNLVVGVADMWLHPAIWPAEYRSQRLRRAASMSITVAATSWFLSHLAAEQGAPVSAHSARTNVLTVCAALMLLGLVLVAPAPRLTRDAVTALLRGTVRRLAAPMILGAGVVAAVHLDEHAVVTTGWRPVVLSCWWISLALSAAQSCAVVAKLDTDVVVPPRSGRLRLGIVALTASALVGGSTLLGFSATGGRLDPWSVAVGTCLLALAVVFAATHRDLRRLPDENVGPSL